MITKERIILTGGAGFIGAALARRLAAANDVVVLDTFARVPPKEVELATVPGVTLVTGDVRDVHLVRDLVAEADRVVHLASIAGVGSVLKHPARTLDVALGGTANVLEACRASGRCQRVAVFSTSEIYGRFAWNVCERDPTPIGPVEESRWSYACAKIATEHLAMAYHREFELPVVTIRPFNVYGPGQIGEGAVHHFVRRALAREPITVNNDGRQLRSWCFIDDMVAGTVAALEHDAAVGEAFNIGNPTATLTVLRLAELVNRLAGSDSPIVFRARDYPDVETRVPSIDKARTLLGFEPTIGLEEGIRRTLRAYVDLVG